MLVTDSMLFDIELDLKPEAIHTLSAESRRYCRRIQDSHWSLIAELSFPRLFRRPHVRILDCFACQRVSICCYLAYYIGRIIIVANEM